MNKKTLTKDQFLEKISEFLTVADVLAAEAISDVSVAIAMQRIKRKMTQKEFAHHMGVSQGMISKWENGDYNFTIKTVAQICEKLELKMQLALDEYESTATHWTTDKTIMKSARRKRAEWTGTPYRELLDPNVAA